MIKLYSMTGCGSSKKARQWLINQGLEFEEINLDKDALSYEDFLKILSLTEEGIEDVISRRSQSFSKLGSALDSMSISELFKMVEENRTLLRRPLIIDEQRLQVGFNDDNIRKFLPRKVRRIEIQEALSTVKERYLEKMTEEFNQVFAS